MRHAIALSLLFLSACGQAGDLYLPFDPAAQPPAQPAPATASPEQKKKESR